jgi:3-methyladenine DNA glycosylase AlkD
MTAGEIEARLHGMGNERAAAAARRFFKAGPEGGIDEDVFLGIKAAPLRQLAREHQTLALEDVEDLLHSPIHEARALALLILEHTYSRSKPARQRDIYRLYLRNTSFVNNWDLVDVSAAPIVGAHLADRSRAPLYRLVRSTILWERRIAIVATHHFIRHNDFTDTLGLAERLLTDREDLIHKAVGWMLREVGKRDQGAEEAFLARHCCTMPCTMLRYAIERFPESLRRQYLRRDVSANNSSSHP